MWILAAVGSAFFAGVTSILAKCGICKTDSDVATAIRTTVVLVFAWVMAGVSGQLAGLSSISPRSFLFLALSGLATGASWICYFHALAKGDVSKVVPLDKTSSVLTILLAIVLFGEVGNLAVKLVGCAVILVGTLLMIDPKAGSGHEASVPTREWLPKYEVLRNSIRLYFKALQSALIDPPKAPKPPIDGALESEIVRGLIEIIREEPNISQEDLGEKLGTTRRVVQKHINELKESGRIVRVGGKRYGHWQIND